MKKIIIFDIDGTLLQDIDGTLLQDNAEAKAYVKAFEISYGITGINENWSSYPSPTDDGITKWILHNHFGRDGTADEIKKFVDTYADLLREIEPILLPGVKEMLDLLRSKETSLALATGNLEQCARIRLEKAGLWPYFRCGAFAEHGYNKIYILEEAIKRCRRLWPGATTNGSFVYFGDHPGDAAAARLQGIHFIGVNGDANRFKGLPVDYVCADYLDKEKLLSIIEQL